MLTSAWWVMAGAMQRLSVLILLAAGTAVASLVILVMDLDVLVSKLF